MKGFVFGSGKSTFIVGGFTVGSSIAAGVFIDTLSLGSAGAFTSGISTLGSFLSIAVGLILAFTIISALGSLTISKSVIPYWKLFVFFLYFE